MPITVASRRPRSSPILTYNSVRSGRLLPASLICSVLGMALAFWRGTIKRLKDLCRLDDPPWKIALGLAVGVFISCTPFYGLHTLMSIGAAFALRVNKLSTITGAWLNLPWFAPFVYGLSLKVGEFILSGGEGLKGLREKSLFDLSATISPYLSVWNAGEGFLASSKLLFAVSKPLFIGTTVVGLVAAVVTYVVALWIIKGARRQHG